MKKKVYSAPILEQISILDEMPILCTSSGVSGGSLKSFSASAGYLI